MTKPISPVSIRDLKVGQIEAIEDEVGLPVHQWKNTKSVVRLFTAILAAAEGKERKDYADLTLAELDARVDLDDDPKAPDPNPDGSTGP